MAKTAKLKQFWVVQPYRHGEIDTSEAAKAYATEAEAIEAAREWADETPYDSATEHECVVLQAVSVFRGKRSASRYKPIALPADEEER